MTFGHEENHVRGLPTERTLQNLFYLFPYIQYPLQPQALKDCIKVKYLKSSGLKSFRSSLQSHTLNTSCNLTSNYMFKYTKKKFIFNHLLMGLRNFL